VEAIGLGHDLGHTPFGHIGEAALDACLRERFGREFRHYEHSVRVAQVLEDLNLDEDVVDGILCHSGRAPLARTLEGRIVRLVDRVAYINHDIDDAIRAGVLDPGALPIAPIVALGDTGSQRIDTLVHDLVEHSAAAGDIVQGEAAGDAMDALRTFMFDHVYLSDSARREQEKIEAVIRTLFEHHVAHPETLPPGDGELAERVTDWIAGMTDRYCIRAFEELSVPNAFAL
jgi:dGTPase